MFLNCKQPFRPGAEVSERYNDGWADICEITDGATAGRLPEPVLTRKIRLDYQERKLGIQRYYAAAQNQIKVERVIRVQHPPVQITSQDAAVTEDGRVYRIDLVQNAPDVWPPSLDLTLRAYTQTADGNLQEAPELPAPPADETETG